MIGDATDMQRRLVAVLPPRWFPDTAPVLAALLAGLAAVWAGLYDLLGFVRLQTRLLTATGGFLDMAAVDFFGTRVARVPGQSDAALLAAMQRELLRERATRDAMNAMLADVTGRPPTIFEPARPADTGAWGGPLGYGVAGGWGSLSLPFQCLVTVFRPAAGTTPVAVTDVELLSAAAGVMPAASVAWVRLQD